LGVAAQKRKAVKPKAVPPKVVPNARPYLGNSDGPSAGPRAGMNEFIKQVIHHSGGALWNNGSYMRRDMKGKPGNLSVHATGRAVDLSYRGSARHPQSSRKSALPFVNKLAANANELGIEMIIDYFPTPYGRAWKCDRQAWKKYSKPTVSGSPGGDWFHIEISPQAADSVIFVKAAFLKVFGEIPPKP
jgi:hypothetical protein